jgi:hypothetical protein
MLRGGRRLNLSAPNIASKNICRYQAIIRIPIAWMSPDGYSSLVSGIEHQNSGIARSLQIFLANGSGISVWRGTAERRFFKELPHHEWRLPSRTSTQPFWQR